MKEEFKQTEGDPAIIKGRTKQVRQIRMRRRMIAAVLNAPVVITNPTHYAIALQRPPDFQVPFATPTGASMSRGKHSVPLPLARALSRHRVHRLCDAAAPHDAAKALFTGNRRGWHLRK